MQVRARASGGVRKAEVEHRAVALRVRALTAALAVGALLALVGPARAHAQSASDLQAAAAAFQEGQRAQLRGEHAQAAELFDLANRSAPSAAALRSSIRMHQAAGHHARAATLAAEARTLYAQDAATVALADEVLAALGPTLAHVLVRCEPQCALTSGGRIVASATGATELYLEPGTHAFTATWGARALTRSVEAGAGTTAEVLLAESEASASTDAPTVAEEPTPETVVERGPGPIAPPPASDDGGDGLSPAFFAIGAGLTAASLVAAIVAGVDMLSARDAYVAMPTEAGWRDGVGRETLTNAFIGTSIALAAVTVGLAIFTDWGGGASSASAGRPQLRLGASPDGAAGSLSIRF